MPRRNEIKPGKCFSRLRPAGYAVPSLKRCLYEARLTAYEDIMRDTRGLSFFAPKIKSGLPLDKNGFMLIQEQRSRVVRFKNQEDKP